jgi:hypothetical protein
MNEETILTIVSTFAGIAVGFALSQGSELWKDKQHILVELAKVTGSVKIFVQTRTSRLVVQCEKACS